MPRQKSSMSSCRCTTGYVVSSYYNHSRSHGAETSWGGANKQATDAMKRDIAAAQEYLVEHEHICSLDNPPVIREYLTASEEDRGIFEVLLKTYKTNTVLKAKEAWYEWKREFLEMVRPDVEAILSGMQEVSSRIITVRHD